MAYTCHKNYKLVPQCQFNYVVLHSSYHYCCNTSKLTFFFRRRAKIKVLTGAISAIQRAPQLASLSKTLATQSKAGLKRLGPFRCSLLASMQPNRQRLSPDRAPGQTQSLETVGDPPCLGNRAAVETEKRPDSAGAHQRPTVILFPFRARGLEHNATLGSTDPDTSNHCTRLRLR